MKFLDRLKGKKPCRCCQSASSGISCLTLRLLPMKLSSTMKTEPRHPASRNASSSASNCGLLFVRGTRP